MGLTGICNRVVVEFDLDGKNTHKFDSGFVMRLERNNANFNMREVQPVNAKVIEENGYIPYGSEIIVHHNSCHPVNQIFDYLPISMEQIASTIKHFAIPDNECYFYREPNTTEWKPCNGFVTALRIYKPYEGALKFIEPALIKNILWITSGNLKNKACHTLREAAYELIFQGIKGREERVIRLRHFEQKKEHERQEIIGINKALTEDIENGKYILGLSPETAKPLTEILAYAD